MREWQDMSSAPLDGSDILALWRDNNIMLVVAYDDTAVSDWVWVTLDGPSYHREAFSHWMPLPPAPSNPGDAS